MKDSMSVKHKKMTDQEKVLKARIKKELKEQGIILPDKPKLNRRKYVDETIRDWNERDRTSLEWQIYMTEAISIMLAKTDRDFRVSQEAVGVAKCLRIAMRLKEFREKLLSEERTEYTRGEKLDFIRDIWEA